MPTIHPSLNSRVEISNEMYRRCSYRQCQQAHHDDGAEDDETKGEALHRSDALGTTSKRTFHVARQPWCLRSCSRQLTLQEEALLASTVEVVFPYGVTVHAGGPS